MQGRRHKPHIRYHNDHWVATFGRNSLIAGRSIRGLARDWRMLFWQ